MNGHTPFGDERRAIEDDRKRLDLYRQVVDNQVQLMLDNVQKMSESQRENFFDAMVSAHRIRFNAETRVRGLLDLHAGGVRLPVRKVTAAAALLGIENIYIVMSTHPNESAVEVHSAHLTMEGAEMAMNTLNDDGDEDSPEAELEVWIETVKVQE